MCIFQTVARLLCDGISKFQEEKAMKCSLEREPHLHEDEELLVPKDEPQNVDQPQEEVHGVE